MQRLTAAMLFLLAVFSLPAAAVPDPLENQARRFVVLATSLGHLRPKEIDAYWGPPDLDKRNKGPVPSVPGLRRDLVQLRDDVRRDTASARRDRLTARLDRLIALLAIIEKPRALGFEEQARQVYGMALPPTDQAAAARALKTLGRLLPGHGDLTSRLAVWRARFTILETRRKTVFLRALAECRARTERRWPLPPDEKLDLVWSSDVPAAWHRYLAHHRSELRINPDAVADPAAALEVACHEAYPGHHAQFLALDAAKGAAVEDRVVILRSPEQMLREGAASYGAELAFTDAERLAFVRDILFPLAGLDRRQAASFLQVHRALAALAPSALPILRDYYDGRIASGDAMARLMLEAQIASPQALLDYTRQMGAYVGGYSAAVQLVADCMGRMRRDDRWAMLRDTVADTKIEVLSGLCDGRQPAVLSPGRRDGKFRAGRDAWAADAGSQRRP